MKFKGAQTLLLLAGLISLIALVVDAKQTSCRNRFTQREDWNYCTKFGAATTGRLRIKMRSRFLAKHSQGAQIQVGVYKDQDFIDIVKNNANGKQMSCKEKRDKATEIFSLEVPEGNAMSDLFMGSLLNTHSPKIFYFAIMDCEQSTHMTYHMMPRIEVELNIVNQLDENEAAVDHFTYEEEGTLTLHLILLFLFAPLFFMAIYRCSQHQKIYQTQHSPFFIIILALFLQLAKIFWKVIHLLMYSSNGIGIPFFDIVSIICQMMSEITLSSLIMLIANGWTITYQDIDIDNNLDIYLPVGAVVIVVHLTLAAMTYVDFDDYHKYHDFAGVQGWVLILFKLGIFAYYQYIVSQKKSKIPRKASGFYKIFLIFGNIYMLDVPLTIFGSFFFPPYQRQFLFFLTSNLVQLISTALMIYQQSSTKSGYFKASLNANGILPTGKMA